MHAQMDQLTLPGHALDHDASGSGAGSPPHLTPTVSLINASEPGLKPELDPKQLSPFSTSVISRQPHFKMDFILSQPHEILYQIFLSVHTTDLARLSGTCHFLRQMLTDDDFLWKQLYLRSYDAPSTTPSSWQKAVKDLVRFEKILATKDTVAKDDQLEFVANTAISLMLDIKTPNSSSPSSNCDLLGRYFSSSDTNRTNISAFLSRSSLFSRAGLPTDFPADTKELRQLSAKLHVYYGLEIEPSEEQLKEHDHIDDDSIAIAEEVHPYARSRVYDLRYYTAKNNWGPFMDDGSGRVDWEKAQNVMIVLAHGLRIFSERTNGEIGPFWDKPFVGLGANSFKSHSFDKVSTEPDLFAGQDPYNVRGTWMRVVNFLDYHDLFAFNFQTPLLLPDQERGPISTKEAFRLILLKLKVTKVEHLDLTTECAEHNDTDPSMPIVHFEGVSKSLHMRWDPNANSQIRGTVRTTKHGDIRWTTFSVFHGEERWRSEGVQIGGINSGRGILGNWFDKDYDTHGPAGPTAFWKISDEFAAAMSG